MTHFSKDLQAVRANMKKKSLSAKHLDEHIDVPAQNVPRLWKDDGYYDIKAISSSLLKKYIRNPSLVLSEHFNQAEEEKGQTKSNKIGSVIHRILLEDRLLKEYFPILTPKEVESFPHIIKNFLNNDVIMNIMKNADRQEFILRWEETTKKAPCKAKVDLWTKDGFLFEFKSCYSLENMRSQVDQYRYDLQLSFYKRGIEQVLEKHVEGVGIIAIETQPPYDSHIYQLDDKYMYRGEHGGEIFKKKVLGWRDIIDDLIFHPDKIKRFEKPVTVLSL